MDRAWFNYKGVDSRDMHIYIENDISFPSPEADVEFIEVLGKDGDVAIDNERLKSVNFSIPVRLRLPTDMYGSQDINQIATEVSNWLKGEIGWFPLLFSGSSEYEYIAMMHEQFNIQETLKQYGRTVLTFRLQPYKRKVMTRPILVSNGMTIINEGTRIAKPLIKITGTGDITLRNNGEEWLVLRAVDQSISVDSEMMEVYRDIRPQYDKMIDLGKFPLLHEGHNTITWTGNISRLEIEPRWEAIT